MHLDSLIALLKLVKKNEHMFKTGNLKKSAQAQLSNSLQKHRSDLKKTIDHPLYELDKLNTSFLYTLVKPTRNL